jgi:hypothetical protein
MTDQDIDDDLRRASHRVRDLSRQIRLNTPHKAHLREELLRRHQELSADSTQRAAGTLLPRFPRLKRLTLVAPPALALSAVASVLLWALQISGHPKPQAAQAQVIARHLARSVPTVTGWTVSIHQQRANTTSSYQMQFRLKPQQRLYVVNNRSYLYSFGRWMLVSPGQRVAALGEWQWAFAVLPSRLQTHSVRLLRHRLVAGRETQGLQYDLPAQHGQQARATAWVDVKTGLVLQLNQVITHGHTVVENDSATYHYQRIG